MSKNDSSNNQNNNFSKVGENRYAIGKKPIAKKLDEGKENASQELLKVSEWWVNMFADVTVRVLREELWLKYDIKEHTGNLGENRAYHINQKNNPQHKYGQMLLTITSASKITVRLNPTNEEDYQSFYYVGEWLNTREFMSEMDTIKAFLSNETPPSNTSRITKINYFD